ncbi:MAG: hypothetical protein LUH22_00250 [Bacteroides sp.]|nr:hypothetical protein [Bacteroides sp.]
MKALNKTDLLQNFVEALIHKDVTRSDLISRIADILHIEKESASRRITGKVQFTIREMGILAQEMDISLDSLINSNNSYTPIFFKMDIPRVCRSIDQLIDTIKNFTEEIKPFLNKKNWKWELFLIPFRWSFIFRILLCANSCILNGDITLWEVLNLIIMQPGCCPKN